MTAQIIYLRRADRIRPPRFVKAGLLGLAQQRGGNQMNIAAYNMAQSHYSATCAVLKNHLGSCSRCRVNPANDADGGVYCDIGLSALDEALRAQAELDQTARDTIAGYCLDCD